jgi:hypothetical protein
VKYLMMIKATPEFEAGAPPSPALMAGMGKLTEEMMQAGVVLAAAGLRPSAHGARLRYAKGGESVLIDGPFTETKEVIASYAIVEAASKDEAIRRARQVLDVHRDAGVPEFEIEIRPIFDPADFAPPR